MRRTIANAVTEAVRATLTRVPTIGPGDGRATAVDRKVATGTIRVAGADIGSLCMGSAAPQTTHLAAESSEIVSQFGQRTLSSSGDPRYRGATRSRIAIC